jgi:hypothetical protein
MTAKPVPGLARSEDCKQEISSFVDSIDRNSDRELQIGLAMGLEKYVSDHRSCASVAVNVDTISGLLSNEVDGVRMEAAFALADIGPPALRALPALKEALKKSDAMLDAMGGTTLPTSYSGQAIRYAIQKITGQIPEPYNGRNRKPIPQNPG